MELKYLDFHIDGDGRITHLATERIRETEHNVHRLRIYSDIETEEETNFKVNIAFTRADGLTVGPLPMVYAQDDKGKWHRFYDLKEKLTEIVGPLVFGVSYNLWEFQDGQLVLKKKFPIFSTSVYVYDTNRKNYDELYDIYARLESVEVKADEASQSAVRIIRSPDEPQDMPNGTIWYQPVKIINNEGE